MSHHADSTGEMLVALLPRVDVLARLKAENWYHLPVAKAPKPWPPKILAFYQGKVFGAAEAYKIRYSGEVARIDVLPRKELFPDDELNQHKAEISYYRVEISRLEERSVPIVSYRPRRLVFIPTTLLKFNLAEQINDLFDNSPLEDLLWKALRVAEIQAERQWRVKLEERVYFLDFAVFCRAGKLAIETDGYTTHYESIAQIDYDTARRNELSIDDWEMLRYTSNMVREDWSPYLPEIQTKIEKLGGLESPENFNRRIGEEQAEYVVDDDDSID